MLGGGGGGGRGTPQYLPHIKSYQLSTLLYVENDRWAEGGRKRGRGRGGEEEGGRKRGRGRGGGSCCHACGEDVAIYWSF